MLLKSIVFINGILCFQSQSKVPLIEEPPLPPEWTEGGEAVEKPRPQINMESIPTLNTQLRVCVLIMHARKCVNRERRCRRTARSAGASAYSTPSSGKNARGGSRSARQWAADSELRHSLSVKQGGNSRVFSMTRPGIEPTAFRSQDRHSVRLVEMCFCTSSGRETRIVTIAGDWLFCGKQKHS